LLSVISWLRRAVLRVEKCFHRIVRFLLSLLPLNCVFHIAASSIHVDFFHVPAALSIISWSRPTRQESHGVKNPSWTWFSIISWLRQLRIVQFFSGPWYELSIISWLRPEELRELERQGIVEFTPPVFLLSLDCAWLCDDPDKIG